MGMREQQQGLLSIPTHLHLQVLYIAAHNSSDQQNRTSSKHNDCKQPFERRTPKWEH